MLSGVDRRKRSLGLEFRLGGWVLGWAEDSGLGVTLRRGWRGAAGRDG